MCKVSIIIRTRNEERWIGHCLGSLLDQDFQDFEIILVDNESSDQTVQVARRFPVATIISLDRFRPGHAINEGIRHSSGEYIVCLSAHCIPKEKTWLSSLLANFTNDKVAGVYGRQLPMAFTEDMDKRDLLIVFGQDRRVQVKDYFFHNANSMIRRDVWEAIPFDEEVTNIEDRVWGKAVIEAGYQIVYDPEAAVYHHHGLHQGNDVRRARGVVSILEKVDAEVLSDLPDALKPEHCNIAAVVPVRGEVRALQDLDLLGALLEELGQAAFLNNIYLIGNTQSARKAAEAAGVRFLERPTSLDEEEATLEDVLTEALQQIEAGKDFPATILYADYLYPFRPKGLVDQLITEAQFKGLDTVFPGFADYSNYWKLSDDGDFVEISGGLLSRSRKQPLYRALYGLGCVSSVPHLRKGSLVGGRVGIYPLSNRRYTLRYTDEKTGAIVKTLLESPTFTEQGNNG